MFRLAEQEVFRVRSSKITIVATPRMMRSFFMPRTEIARGKNFMERTRPIRDGDFSLPAIDYSRIVSNESPSVFPYSEDHFQKRLTSDDVWEHGRMQGEFDKSLGRKYSAKDMLTRSYNPVTDRWHIDILRRKGDKTGELGYRNEMIRNIKGNLRERLQVSENIVRYRIEGSELYSEDFPQEPFNKVIRRGMEYRLAHGTQEAAREGEKGEVEGWEKMRAKFTNPETPIGTKITYFSPPGRIKDTAYDRQLVDEFELRQDGDGRYLKVTRKIVDFDDASYIKAALSLDPQYFDNYDKRPLDAWFLSHPVEGSLPNIKAKGKMDAPTFERIYESNLLQGIINKYIETVSAESIDWWQVAKHVNAIYNQIDAEEKNIRNGDRGEKPLYISQEAIEATVQRLGWQTPEEKRGGRMSDK